MTIKDETVTGATSGADRATALAERIVSATAGTLELFTVHLGRELGLYRALADGPASPRELAERAPIAERYAREWLEQQAVAGLLGVEPEPPGGCAPEERRFVLPAELRGVLVDPEDPLHVTPLADMVAGIAHVLDLLPDAFRTGEGIGFHAYGEALRRGQGGINRPAFVHEVADWLAVLDECAGTGTPARVADVACGEGWSTVALARALPDAEVDGFDSDEASVDVARKNVARAGVADRATVQLVDASDPDALAGPYDLVTVFEAVHDAARPVEMLAGIRASLAPGGTVLVADERVADAFAPDGDEIERMMYGWSVTHCLPASLATSPSAGLGTVLRADTLRELAAQAGFSGVEVLPIDNDFFRFYRLEA